MQHLLEAFFALVFAFHAAVVPQRVEPSYAVSPPPRLRLPAREAANGYAEAACRTCRQTTVSYRAH